MLIALILIMKSATNFPCGRALFQNLFQKLNPHYRILLRILVGFLFFSYFQIFNLIIRIKILEFHSTLITFNRIQGKFSSYISRNLNRNLNKNLNRILNKIPIYIPIYIPIKNLILILLPSLPLPLLPLVVREARGFH